jgi:hypothetical protein
MGFLSDKCEEVRKWFAIGSDVYPDPVVTGWIRMAEEYLSTALRVKHMIQFDTCRLTIDRAPLPLDWQEIRFARLFPSGPVLRYNTPDAFYNPEFPDAPKSPYPGRNKRYTILGNFLVVEDVGSGLDVELAYYQDIPPLTEELNNWPNRYHPTVYMLKILHIASMYSIEDERSAAWDKEVVRSINDMNRAHQIDKASGSTLIPVRRKTFG